jgi:ribonuclease P protein component
MGRRTRLSRSRDFDTVYRQGRATSSRFLVLYTFRRPDDEASPGGPRLGLAVPRKAGGAVERNRIKRRLRAAFEQLRPVVDPDCDYVIVVRPGLVEAAEARGFDWLVERVEELLAGPSTEGPGT